MKKELVVQASCLNSDFNSNENDTTPSESSRWNLPVGLWFGGSHSPEHHWQQRKVRILTDILGSFREL